jgi:hypothetical protein
MNTIKYMKKYMLFIALFSFLAVFTGCQQEINSSTSETEIAAIPGVVVPVTGAFPDLTVTDTADYTGTVAWVSSSDQYAANTVYTATITLTAKTGFTLTGVSENFFTVDGATSASNAIDSGVVTAVFPATGAAFVPRASVNLRTAADFVVLAKTGVSTVPTSDITGDVGISPAAETYLTGFSQTDAIGYATSPQVTGFLYAADMVTPTSDNLTTAVADMETAYSDASGRITPDQLNYNVGEIGGQTLAPGLYKWTTGVTIIDSNVTLSGGATAIWIFQIDGDLTLASAKQVTLSGGALAKNIVWQVAGTVTMGANSHLEGVVLCKTNIAMQTSASMNGRLLAQTSIALGQATVTQPAL